MAKNPPVIKSFGTLLRNVPEVEAQAAQFIVGAAPAHLLDTIKLPTNFDGRKIWSKYLSGIKDQKNCGMCYSCSTVGALADRFSILTLGAIHTNLSASDMVMCMTTDPKTTAITQSSFVKKSSTTFHEEEVKTREQNACLGNTLYNAAKYLFIEGAPSEQCIPDSLVTGSTGNDSVPFCEDIEGVDFDYCVDKKTAQRYYRAGSVYQLPYDEKDLPGTERQIMMDIYKWGPIAAGFLVFDDFLNNYDGTTIYTSKGTGKAPKLGHAIRVIGWGEEMQDKRLVKYWLCANSWSTAWGDDGYFKVERFLEGIDLEKNTMSLIPDVPGIVTFSTQYDAGMITQDDRNARRSLGVSLYTLYPSEIVDKIRDGLLVGDINELIIRPCALPHDYSSFIAGKINTYDLNALRNNPPTSTWVWIAWIVVIVLAFLFGGLFTYLWLKYKGRIVRR